MEIKELLERLARHEQYGDCPPKDVGEKYWRAGMKKY